MAPYGYLTNNSIGKIEYNTFLPFGQSLESIIVSMLDAKELSFYDSISTIRTQNDLDFYLQCFNHNNNYTYNGYTLKIGDKITLVYTYDNYEYLDRWVIAGFDCEKSMVASDGTVYDNGYGINIIPENELGTGYWNHSSGTSGGYFDSDARNTLHYYEQDEEWPSNIQIQLLLPHIVNRNVLLSNKINSTRGYSTGAVWTNDKLTLLSDKQLATNNEQFTTPLYDFGEANYTLPLFSDDESRKTQDEYNYWTRCININPSYSYYVNYVGSNGNINMSKTNESRGIRPMVYIR